MILNTMRLTDEEKNVPLTGISVDLEDLEYYTFTNLSRYSELKHGIFTRKGGASKSPFNSMNVGFSSGDRKETVLKNRERVARCISRETDLEQKRMIYLNQVHGKAFAVFKKNGNNASSLDQADFDIIDSYMVDSDMADSDIVNSGIAGSGMAGSGMANAGIANAGKPEADGIITDIEGIFAVIQVADCQAVILYDPVRKVVANIHSGWRGSLLNILGTGVNIMERGFGTDPGDIVAAVSPSLGPCCSEFKHYRKEIPRYLWKYRLNNNGNHFDHFDFWQMSCDQLVKEGVKPENIEISRVCTPCNSHIFYSYRKEKNTGRFAVVAGICNSMALI